MDMREKNIAAMEREIENYKKKMLAIDENIAAAAERIEKEDPEVMRKAFDKCMIYADYDRLRYIKANCISKVTCLRRTITALRKKAKKTAKR